MRLKIFIANGPNASSPANCAPVARAVECATYPKCADDKIGNDARGWINLGGVDLRSFSIKSKSVANELNNCNRRTNKTYLILWLYRWTHSYLRISFIHCSSLLLLLMLYDFTIGEADIQRHLSRFAFIFQSFGDFKSHLVNSRVWTLRWHMSRPVTAIWLRLSARV